MFRLAEAAEAALHTALGIADLTFGVDAAVGVQAESTAARFNDRVEVELGVEAIGHTPIATRWGSRAGTARR